MRREQSRATRRRTRARNKRSVSALQHIADEAVARGGKHSGAEVNCESASLVIPEPKGRIYGQLRDAVVRVRGVGGTTAVSPVVVVSPTCLEDPSIA